MARDRKDASYRKDLRTRLLLAEDLRRLRVITAPCRDNMHSPNEQDLEAHVVGDHLDNARGESISEESIGDGSQEYVVILRRYDAPNYKWLTEKFNLASLIALARRAAT